MEDNRDKKLSSEKNHPSKVDQSQEDKKILDHAASAWKEIQMQAADTFEQIEPLLEVVRHFIHTYPDTSQYNSALELGQWLEDKRDLLLAWDSEFRLRQFLRRESDFREKARQRLEVLRQQVQAIPSTLPPATPNTRAEGHRSTHLQRQFFFAFKDPNQKLLTPPFACLINGKDFSNQPEVAIALDVETSEVQITLSKAGFKPYTGNLSIQHYFDHAQEGGYCLLLVPEIYTLTLKVIKPDLQDKKANAQPVPNAEVEVNITSKLGTGSRYVQYITDSQGCLLISDLRYGDNISGKIHTDGLEGAIWIPDFKGDWTEMIIRLEDKKQPDHNTEQQRGVHIEGIKEKQNTNNLKSDESIVTGMYKNGERRLFYKNRVGIFLLLTGAIIAISSAGIYQTRQIKKDKLNELKYSLIIQVDSITNPSHYQVLTDLDTLVAVTFGLLEQLTIENPPLLNTYLQEIRVEKEEHAAAIHALRRDTLQAIEQRFYKVIDTVVLTDSTRMRWRITREVEEYFINLLHARKQAIENATDALNDKIAIALDRQ